MATKKKTTTKKKKKVATKKKASTKRSTARRTAARRGALGVSVRMYRLDVGDCFLLSVKRKRGRPFWMLIDCGVHMAVTGGTEKIREVVQDILDTTDGRLDVVVGTHEHWDHISGFKQAEDLFRQFEVGEVWVAWTENEEDSFAKSLRKKRERAIRALGAAAQAMQGARGDTTPEPLTGLLGFYGDTTGKNLRKAGEVLWALAGDGDTVKYREPGEAPIPVPNADARFFVLGPPRDKELIKRSAPRKSSDEVYFGSYANYVEEVEAGFSASPPAPFAKKYAIPLESTRGMAFFNRHYWADRLPEFVPNSEQVRMAGNDEAETRDRFEQTQGWRRIDAAWVDTATTLALKLDEDTNNTSLVLALEVGEPGKGDVLLFAADAQVGNWLSWKTVEWENIGGRRVTGHDLLRRTILYKVGHHASHNATLQHEGLELMEAIQLALVPTSEEMAGKVKLGTLPWPKLLDRLEEKTDGGVIRTDLSPKGKAAKACAVVEDLYYEVRL